ncbi:uncharacterized protein SAPINGB_P000269 [Magnusiomyces paraingens]|uniref:ER-derived vesicles protein ERV29 n=1 Tax=Magnusiomyces paraingens TaxID=2606893 RepID=A0A5E8AZA3_9ASCO|nr:uncharacterized protein SAPINGB_P000269 [Saprochaete ingens]VVT44034.1 unnamed protein product [Saprochaete ingens]
MRRPSAYDLSSSGSVSSNIGGPGSLRPTASMASLRSNYVAPPLPGPLPTDSSSDLSFSQSASGFAAWKAAAHVYTEKFDAFLGKIGAPLKPFLPLIGRFFIVATFYEDGFRIFSQWNSQVSYISGYRGLPRFITVVYLAINIVIMFVSSSLVVAHKSLVPAVASLSFVVISQAIIYGLAFNLSFFFRNLSVIGGLLMVLSAAFVKDRRAISLPGLPLVDDKNRAKYFQLAGRILLIFLYLAYVVAEQRTAARIISSIFGLAACGLVVIGYKARLSAAILVIMLFWRNFTSNQYWRYDPNNPVRDFLRYEHFQILSIIGGLILVVSAGAGAISIDEKKKIY